VVCNSPVFVNVVLIFTWVQNILGRHLWRSSKAILAVQLLTSDIRGHPDLKPSYVQLTVSAVNPLSLLCVQRCPRNSLKLGVDLIKMENRLRTSDLTRTRYDDRWHDTRWILCDVGCLLCVCGWRREEQKQRHLKSLKWKVNTTSSERKTFSPVVRSSLLHDSFHFCVSILPTTHARATIHDDGWI